MRAAAGDCILHSVSQRDIAKLAQQFAIPVQTETVLGFSIDWRLPDWVKLLAKGSK